MRALARRVDVVTFDHEQVDLAIIRSLLDDGVVIRPGLQTLEMAVDKAHMRAVLVEAGIPVPAHVTVEAGVTAGVAGAGPVQKAENVIAAFGGEHGWPLVLKTARGGYDGKGVWPVRDLAEASAVVGSLNGTVLVEAMVPFQAELAVMVARRPSGEMVTWPATETAQVDGVCREVLVPGRLPPEVVDRAGVLGRQVAEIADALGVLAIELFWSDGVLMVNEIAARPHNSGHWTIEGSVTSQFENHLRAVLDLPLGSTAPQHAQVANVNIFGGPAGQRSGRSAAAWPGRGRGPHPPVWQRGQTRAQTRTRDGLWGRMRRACASAPGRPRWPWARPTRAGSASPAGRTRRGSA